MHAKAAGRTKGDANGMWNQLKDCLLEVSDETYGRTKGRRRHRDTWWWNEDVARCDQKRKGGSLKFGRSQSMTQTGEHTVWQEKWKVRQCMLHRKQKEF
jgi:hypothetical protein